jgi:hypothetical protein
VSSHALGLLAELSRDCWENFLEILSLLYPKHVKGPELASTKDSTAPELH